MVDLEALPVVDLEAAKSMEAAGTVTAAVEASVKALEEATLLLKFSPPGFTFVSYHIKLIPY